MLAYANSSHVDAAPQPTAPAAPSPGESVLNYPETGKESPTGAPLEELPAELRAVRAERGQYLHTSQAMYSGLNGAMDDAFSHIADKTERGAAVAEWQEIFSDLRLSSTEAENFVGLLRAHRETPADASTQAGWQKEAQTHVAERYRGREVEAMRIAKAFVARDPNLANVLNRTGLGNHPWIVEKIIAEAYSQRGTYAERR